MKQVWRLLLALAVLVMALTPSAALAIGNPDAPLTLSPIKVYRNLLETGDQLYVAEYNIVYTVQPTDPATSTYMVRLMNGATELGVTIPYTYTKNGYGKGVVSLYFSSATVTAKGMGWAQAYNIVISGNPSFFATPPITTVTLAAGNYTSETTQSGNRLALAATVLTMANDLTADWGITLVSATSAGNQLNAAGQVYFGNAILNLVNMAPTLYPAQTISPSYPTPETFTQSSQTTAYSRFASTFWLNFASASDYGPSARWFTGVLVLAACVAVLYAARIIMDGDMRPGFYPAAVVMLIGTWWGWVAWPIVFIGAFVLVLVMAFDIFLNRA